MKWLIVVLVLVCCGCGSGKGGADMTTMTKQVALQRVEDYVHQAVAVLPPEARLEALSPAAAHDCDDPTDHGPKGRVFASNLYWIRGLPKEQNEAYLAALRRWWSEHGFSIVTDAWDKAQVITLENKENGFRMSLGGPEGTSTSVHLLLACGLMGRLRDEGSRSGWDWGRAAVGGGAGWAGAGDFVVGGPGSGAAVASWGGAGRWVRWC